LLNKAFNVTVEKVFLDKLKQCDEEAIAVFVDVYGETVYRAAYRLMIDKHAAMKLTEQIFTRLLENSGLVEDAGKLKIHVHTTALDVLHEYYRSHYKRNIINELLSRLKKKPEPIPIKKLSPAEIRDIVLTTMTFLSPLSQRAVMLRYYHRLDLDETAAVLKLGRGTIKRQILRAVAFLKHKLRKEIK
jgi:RNA polymerase sigma factor (sigma-70 family)